MKTFRYWIATGFIIAVFVIAKMFVGFSLLAIFLAQKIEGD